MDKDRIAIFFNTNADAENKQPHVRCLITIGGVEYDAGAWPSKSGKCMSFSGLIKLKQPREQKKESRGEDYIPY